MLRLQNPDMLRVLKGTLYYSQVFVICCVKIVLFIVVKLTAEIDEIMTICNVVYISILNNAICIEQVTKETVEYDEHQTAHFPRYF